MNLIDKGRHNVVLPGHQTTAATSAESLDRPTDQLPPSSTDPPSKAVAKRRVFSPLVVVDGHRIQIPMEYLNVEPQPVWACNDNPVFNERGAAELIGISAELLKKWRQRNQGPDYIQYGKAGPIRYELSVLKAFRAANTVHVSSKP